jgi:hypothetical protein
MKNLGLLLIVIVGLFVWNKSCRQPIQEVSSGRSRAGIAESVPGGPVRQLQREPSSMMEREGALPQPGSGVAPKAMLDTVTRGLQNPGER